MLANAWNVFSLRDVHEVYGGTLLHAWAMFEWSWTSVGYRRALEQANIEVHLA